MAKRVLPPASLAIATAVRDHCRPAVPWLVGCSGGRDSLALAVVAAAVARRAGNQCRALVVDHRLQPGSERIAARTVAQLQAHGVDADAVRVDVDSAGGPEAAARRARYAALRAAASGLGEGTEILVGHTLDDQAETVLLGLLRGSGVRALAGMAVRSGEVVRPMLALRRTVTEAACREQGLAWWDDPHNASPDYARSRLRTAVLPVLEAELGGGVVDALGRTARLARDDADLLDQLADEAADHDAAELRVDDVAGLPAALRRRVVLAWLRGLGVGDLQLVHVEAVDALLTHWHGQGPIDLPGGRAAARADGRLRLVPGRYA